MSTVELAVTGMICQHCVMSVTNVLEEQPHVVGATVDLAAGRVSVETDGRADVAELIAAVTESGYEAVPVKTLEIGRTGSPVTVGGWVYGDHSY